MLQVQLTKMEWPSFSMSLLVSVLLSFWWATLGQTHEGFLRCLLLHSDDNVAPISNAIYTQNNSSFASVLDFPYGNLRFSTPTTPKPLVIVKPTHVSHIQATVNCSRKHGLQVRVRSGGHDYEGLSYVAQDSFVVIDLIDLRSINVDVGSKTAWIQAGATIGELYYRIAEKSTTLAFPAGVCPTVGVGGHFSGGGYGMLMRKFGIAADHIIDAHLVDVDGRILDRKSMGEDLFWAIRGGGGASFGVVVAWKVELVSVPPVVTVFTINKVLEENATKLVHRWQYAAPKSPEDLFLRIFFTDVNSTQEGKRTIQASFVSMFLGRTDQLVKLMQENFPELRLVKEDCHEMNWIESIIYFAEIPNSSPLDALLDRNLYPETFFKAKSDYVKEPIPETALEGLWQRFYEEKPGTVELIFSPYGGKMDEIPESETPFPHRAGNLYKIYYEVLWEEEDNLAPQKHLDWMRRLYSYMAPYVSKSPREAYVNYRDLDLGTNNKGNYTSYRQASKWGVRYFKHNFNRLVRVKTMVDPHNFFRNEQSIPPLVRE
ncbi:PREDICTED: tetrahydrocannabinolic acid synthase [Theobroma cacao]|uniref:Tetrahydrocannabinolic acid synthase n=1 Tax=Theobroma cacao TaxID=3641 RepID=A0AB32VJJ7_THECC|nr:PREDICTED: tetrahydrocannabinolic acid synthase [Theobroma cacao]